MQHLLLPAALSCPERDTALHGAALAGEALEAVGVVVGLQQAVGGAALAASLVPLLQDQRLGQQHPGHGDEAHEEQEDLWVG